MALLALVLGTRLRHLATPLLDPGGAARLRCAVAHRRPAVRPAGGCLVVANHISWLDIPLIAAALPGRMLAKTEVRHWPVLGPLAARGGTLFLERDRLRALPATVAEIAAALHGGARGHRVPRGVHLVRPRAQGRFRHAVFQAALDAGVARAARPHHLPAGSRRGARLRR